MADGSDPGEKEVRGLRCYAAEDGSIYPSVSAVLDLLHPIPEYVPQVALDTGAVYHEWVYEYLRPDQNPLIKHDLRAHAAEKAYHRVTKLYDWIDLHVERCDGAERVVWDPVLRIAGRVDFCGTADGRQSILDFKFAEKISPRYEFQLEAYGWMLPSYPHKSLIMIPENGVVRQFIVYPSPRRRALVLAALTVVRYRIEG